MQCTYYKDQHRKKIVMKEQFAIECRKRKPKTKAITLPMTIGSFSNEDSSGNDNATKQ